MSRRWLLSLLCLSVLCLSLVQFTSARGEFKIDEANTRVLLEKQPAEVLLSVENSTGETLNAKVEVELLDPKNSRHAGTSQTQSIAAGRHKLILSLPLAFSSLHENERRRFLWYRLRYRVTENGSSNNTIAEGIVSLSEITPDLFDLRVVASEFAREGSRYLARVKASHPITGRPAPNVQLDGAVTLKNGDDQSVKLRASKTTDSRGYAVLEFAIPPLLAQFRQDTQADDNELHITGKRGAIVASATGEVLLDQFARVFVTTDKPLYQPGQVMHVRALLFAPSKHALANENTLIRISDREGTTVFRTLAKTSRFGVATADWSIPENTRLGDYQIAVGVEGSDESNESTVGVRITRYDLPNFTVSVEPDRTYYLPGQNAEVKVRADYLFGQPVTRGRVRVVREDSREWNYREQKWEVDEGETYEGETDAKGVFVARINLARDHENLNEYNHFSDTTYAAYFTDPTTNRTEQRRFDLRVTANAIHVYIFENEQWVDNKSLPFKFYVSTLYADGSPAQSKVNISVEDPSSSENEKISLTTVRTNRYGVAKVSGVRWPSALEGESEVYLIVSAVDSKGLKGEDEKEFYFHDRSVVRVETDKAIYRPGEPVTAFISSSVPEQMVVVEVLKESSVIQAERVKLRNGRGSVVFAYTPEFKDKLTVAAYGDFPTSHNHLGKHTILYPRNPELKVNVRSSQTSYRPGEEASVNFRVRSPEGRLAESALGVVVIDKAVEERFRTVQEFGSTTLSVNDSFARFLGVEDQVAGITLRDLQRLDASKNISPELDLVADLLLSRSGNYSPRFYGGNQYEHDQEQMFRDSIKEQLKPVRDALTTRYARTAEYPKDEQTLRRFLLESNIDFNRVRDPWGLVYRPSFSMNQGSDEVALISAGADKRFNTDDDFFVERLGWPYFRPVGEAIDIAVKKHHERTGSFIRDEATLRHELTRHGLSPDQLRDRWGKPYLFEFDVKGTDYVIKVKSGGPDGQFSVYLHDDFIIWTSQIDYFQETRPQIDAALSQHSQSTKKVPATEQELRNALQNSPVSLENLRDPWNRSYYAKFNTETFHSHRVRIEDHTTFGQSATARTVTTPLIQTARFITLRSMGADGKAETPDDFSVATFVATVSEQRPATYETQASNSPVLFSGNSGGIYGVVTDPMGAVIARTTVTAQKPGERHIYETVTGDDGTYGFLNLPPGVYELRFEAPGFKIHVVTHVFVRASSTIDMNVTLEVGHVAEVVTVTGSYALTDSSMNASRSTLAYSVSVASKSGTSQLLSTPRLREYFPETLVWQPSIETDKHGRARINFKLADNITTWKMLVIGSTEDGELGITEKEIKAFQPFFVEHDPPRVLTDGDEISMPVTVRNFLERPQKVELEIKPENWFSLIGPAQKRLNIAAGDAMRETFDFRAITSIRDGKQRITAIGSDDSDAIEKPVTVHPDGEEQSVTAGDIVADRSMLELELPQAMLPNSKRAELKIYPNLMAHVIEGVEAIMKRPYGCGEQTISSTYPSLLLLRHYKQSGEDSPLRARAEKYVKEGYNRLLNYREENGGFSYWGKGDPNIALTAYALRFLTSASDVISVDPEVIEKAHEWLVSQQQAYEHNTSLTAYVTRVLAEVPAESSERVKSAVNHLGKTAGESNEPYVLASYALAAMHIGDVSRAKPAIEKLRTLSHSQRNTFYWSLVTATPFHAWGRTGDVETTAIVIQALTKYCDSEKSDCEAEKKLINGALMFLLREKDRYGAWHSTQATINSLDAMLMLFAKNSAARSGSGETSILVNGGLAQTIEIPVSDRLNNPITVDITQFLNPGTNRIEFRRPGGVSLATVQAVANFYVPWAESSARSNGKQGLRLQVKFDKTDARINDEITCTVETERVGSRGDGMLLAEIGLPPGAEVDRSTLEKALDAPESSISRYDVLPDRVVVYLWPRESGVKFNFKFRPRFGLNAKTAPSTIYDYYNPQSRATVAPATFRVR